MLTAPNAFLSPLPPRSFHKGGRGGTVHLGNPFSKHQPFPPPDVSKVDQLPPLPLDRLAQLFPRRRSRVSSSSDGAPGETPEARYFAATKELVLTRYTHQVILCPHQVVAALASGWFCVRHEALRSPMTRTR